MYIYATDAILTRVPLTSDARDVAAPPSVPHLAADLTLRASVHGLDDTKLIL